MKCKITLDTNVIISMAIYRNENNAIAILKDIIGDPDIELIYTDSIYKEYEDVLLRPKFKFGSSNVQRLLTQIKSVFTKLKVSEFPERLQDAKDEIFYYLLLSTKNSYLITGNLKHFPKNSKTVSPREFIELYFGGKER